MTTSIGIIGGGLAGLAAAVAAVERGLRVELFEQGPAVGGRAGSFRDSGSDDLIDLSPHVAMGCCTNLQDFCRRTGVSDSFARHTTLHFIAPDGACYDFAACRWLPAPLHLLPGLWRLGYLTRRDKWQIARGLLRLARRPRDDDRLTIGEWLREEGQSAAAIERFWSLVLVSALGDTLDRVAAAAAQKVFVDGFLASPHAYEVLVPREPLGQVWRRVGAWLAARGAVLHPRSRIACVENDGQRATAIISAAGTRYNFDFLVSTVGWRHIGRLLGPTLGSTLAIDGPPGEFEPSPITAVHLWFDRPITDLPHAAIVGRLSQWLFRMSGENHYAVVISASHGLAGRDRKEIVLEVLRDLAALWPAAKDAVVRHERVVTQPAAVFSVRPGMDRFRPAQRTSLPNFFLAGDWTATGWPATMEGAVRSGYLAVEGVLATLGCRERILVGDLPRGMLARWLVGGR